MSAPVRTAVQTWRALEDAAWSAELRRIRGLSEDDLDRELGHVGIDPNAARTVCQDVVEAAARAAGVDPRMVKADPHRLPTGAWVPPPKRRRSGLALFLVAAIASAGVVIVAAWSFGSCGHG